MSGSMKIIKRILADVVLRKEHLTVTYWDSVAGLLERPFKSFSWNFEADFGWCPFVVPGWQITQLKYRSRVVWSDVLDQTFDQVRKLCTQDQPKESHEIVHSRDATPEDSQERATKPQMHQPQNHQEPKVRQELNLKPRFIISARIHHPDLSDVFWYRPSSPNFFICQRLCSPVFTEKAVQVQEKLCEQAEEFRKLLYTPEMFHLTLCTVSLSNLEEVAGCFQALHEACETAVDLVPHEPLELQDVNTFNRRVLYVSFNENADLHRLVSHFTHALNSSGYRLHDSQRFTPHITLMKLNAKQYRRIQIDPVVVEQFRGEKFGTLPVRELHLCLMGQSRDETGFYRSFGRITFTPAV